MTASAHTASDAATAGAGGASRFKDWFNRRGWRKLIIATPYAWLLFFFLAPFGIVLAISLAGQATAIPPFNWAGGWSGVMDNINYNYGLPGRRPAVLVRLCEFGEDRRACHGLLPAAGLSHGLRHRARSGAWRNILLLLVILPFWTSFLLRIYAWMGMLNTYGTINNVLIYLHIINEPLQMMNTNFAVYIGIVYSYLPFMILPLYANLERLDMTLNEAAMDLGSRPWRTFLDVTLPLSLPGIIAGGMLVFIPATGEYVIPALLGRADSPMIGRVLFDEFFLNHDWPVASAVAVVLLFLLVVPIMVFNHYQGRQTEDGQ